MVLNWEVDQHGATGRKIQGQGLRTSQDPEDVLIRHRQSNKASKAPATQDLEIFRQKQLRSGGGRGPKGTRATQAAQDDDDDSAVDEPEDEEDEDTDGKQRKSRTAQDPDPTQEAYYERDWRKVVCYAKDGLLIDMINDDLFPSGEDFKPTEIAKYLTDAIAHVESTTDIELSTGEDYHLFCDIPLTKY